MSIAERPRDVEVRRDVAYLDPARKERLDLYIPARDPAERTPGMVVIHGGGWCTQRKDGRREQAIARTLAGAGYVCASVDYLLVDFDRPAATFQR